MKEKIKEILVKAMKEKDAVTRNALRYINSEIAKKEKEMGSVTDSDVISIIKKEIKSIEETTSLIAGAGREEELMELNYRSQQLASLLPKQLSEEEVRLEVEFILSYSQFPNMGCAMKGILSTSLAEKADKALIAKIVKEKFNG